MKRKDKIAILLAGLALGTPLCAQNAATPERQEDTRFLRRFSLVGRISVMGSDLLKAGESTYSATELEFTTTSKSKSARVGAGPAIEFRATPKLSFSADFIYHRFGYKTTTETLTGVDDEDTTADERKQTTTAEETRAAFWDIPIIARYSVHERYNGRMKGFVSAGVAFRSVGGIRTAWEKTDPNGDTCCVETPAAPAHRSVRGLIVGAGIRAVDDFGINVIPEVRYTYWLADTFSSNAARARRGQLQILVGFTF